MLVGFVALVGRFLRLLWEKRNASVIESLLQISNRSFIKSEDRSRLCKGISHDLVGDTLSSVELEDESIHLLVHVDNQLVSGLLFLLEAIFDIFVVE